MHDRVFIDGNNLLHAVRDGGLAPALGPETLVRRVAAWAKGKAVEVVLVFDGPPPGGALLRQMTPAGLDVRFSAPASADDVIVQLIREAPHRARLRVISNDKAIRYEARARGCQIGDTDSFIAELFPTPTPNPPAPRKPEDPEKPENLSSRERDHWRHAFGVEDDKSPPFDGSDAMQF